MVKWRTKVKQGFNSNVPVSDSWLWQMDTDKPSLLAASWVERRALWPQVIASRTSDFCLSCWQLPLSLLLWQWESSASLVGAGGGGLFTSKMKVIWTQVFPGSLSDRWLPNLIIRKSYNQDGCSVTAEKQVCAAWETSDQGVSYTLGRTERDVKVFIPYTPPHIAVWHFKLRNYLSLEYSTQHFQTMGNWNYKEQSCG